MASSKLRYLVPVLLLTLTLGVTATANAQGGKPKITADQIKQFIMKDSGGGFVYKGELYNYSYDSADMAGAVTTLGYTVTEPTSPCTQPSKNPSSYTYDYESSAFSYVDTWVRHTKGAYDSNTKGLTTYGDMTWYNTSGWTAVPYRWEDVALHNSVRVRDLDTQNVIDRSRNDTGPVQGCVDQGYGWEEMRWRIADLDQNDFNTLHGGGGVLYGRTYIILTQYNP